jgi:hypothetical protein
MTCQSTHPAFHSAEELGSLLIKNESTPTPRQLLSNCLIPAMSMSLANLVSIKRAGACSRPSANQSAFSATRDPANAGAGETGSRNGQLVTMLLPESAMVASMTSDLR